jgi:nucleoside-diphosphate-sugar epimerase
MKGLANAGASTIALDLFDHAAVRRAVGGHDAIVNLATHLPASSFATFLPWAWRENDRIRRDASALLADAAIDSSVGCFIQESFAPIYEGAAARWIDEDAAVRAGRYNRSCLDAERSAQRFTERGGRGIVLRFAGFYGADSRMLHDMLPFVRRGMSPLPGAADAFWSSISHDDAASGVVAVINAPAGIYNVSDDEPLTRMTWAGALADAVGVRHPRPMPRWMSRLMGSVGEVLSRSQRVSNAKLRALGWAPRWPSAREGLRAALAGDRQLRDSKSRHREYAS